MTNFQTDDVVFATLTQRGKTIANVCLSGISSMSHVLKNIREQIPGLLGMATLSVRNSSQGWSTTQTFYLR